MGVLVGEGKPNAPSTASKRKELRCLGWQENAEARELKKWEVSLIFNL